MRFVKIFLLHLTVFSAVLAAECGAEILDPGSPANSFLDPLAEPLEVAQIDVVRNLNDRDTARGNPERPRLGQFPDLPVHRYPGTLEINAWEQALVEGAVAGLAILPETGEPGSASGVDAFYHQWLNTAAEDRRFVSLVQADLDSAKAIHQYLQERGYLGLLLTKPEESQAAGRLYSTAAVRLAIDSRAARGDRRQLESIKEFYFLGQRLSRDDDTLVQSGRNEHRRIARSEPSVFRKNSLGDESTDSTVNEIIVPGGIALGETAKLPADIVELRFTDNRFLLYGGAGQIYRLPDLPVTSAKALFDWVRRAVAIHSDAIVDIDGDGRVKISSALRDTDIGYDIVEMDTFPFEFVRGLPVTKSVIIDKSVVFEPQIPNNQLVYNTNFEVRFLSADTMRIAQTRVALEYEYDSVLDAARHDYTWGRDRRRLDENLNYSGLGESVVPLAKYAAWAALFRNLYSSEPLEFLHGRYEFMKIEKAGRETPSRF